jgi:hypothetical protein
MIVLTDNTMVHDHIRRQPLYYAFTLQVFTFGQPVVFQFKSFPLVLITIKDIEVTDLNAIKSGKESKAIQAEVRLG